MNEIKYAKQKKGEPQYDDSKFERAMSEILDKPEKAKLAYDIFGQMEFDFGDEKPKIAKP